MGKILLIEPDPTLSDKLAFVLQQSGFQVASTMGGQRALVEIDRSPPDLIVMAESSHRLSGNELCIHIRNLCQAPIIILGQEQDEAAGIEFLEMGADAYLASPLNMRELLARVRSLLRRYEEEKQSASYGTGKGITFFGGRS